MAPAPGELSDLRGCRAQHPDRDRTEMGHALLSHAAKILGTESYHPDRSEVGFELGYRAIYRLAQGADSGLGGVSPTAAELVPPEVASSPARYPASDAVTGATRRPSFVSWPTSTRCALEPLRAGFVLALLASRRCNPIERVGITEVPFEQRKRR
jgi:hypothetical protein